ncbi:MAG: EAL domain-containing protein [Pseudomonadota bacterium]|nr:EAL domain-containing protein [Pseudomonadota bacterium]
MNTVNSHSHTILVVDGNEESRIAISDSLSAAGFNTVEARNAKLALVYYKQVHPDLVLMDLDLPDVAGGLALCSELTALAAPANVPVIVLSHHNEMTLAATVFDAGAADFVIHPLNHLVLVQRCRYQIRASMTLISLKRRERILEHAERIANMGSWEWDSKTGELMVSREFNRMLGFTEDRKTSVRDVLEKLPESERLKIIRNFQQADSKHQGRITLHHRVSSDTGLGRTLRHEARFVLHNEKDYSVYGTIHDITEEIAHKDQILQLAYYDTLTQLPNRTFFKTHLDHAIKQARQKGHLLAVILLDLDLFTRINNSLGHEAGDELLKKVSNRLLRTFDDERCTALNMHAIDPQAPLENMTDKIARLEGDQFAVLVNRFKRLDDVILFVQKMLKQLVTPFTLQGNNIVLTASAGIALYPVNGLGSEMILRNADAAMHFAKSQGRNNFHFYSSDIDFKSKERLSVENDLRHAIRHNELELHYQPKLHLKNGGIQSVEALVRWNHPVRGLVSPSQFVPMAEEIGLINELGEWLINKACLQAKQWNESGLQPIRIAINLSPIQFRGSPLVQMIRNGLLAYRLAPSQLEVEVTETVLLEDTNRVLRTLDGIRNLGVKVALDDFGTGYSSLSYLTRFPFNTLKIDRSFVSQCIRKGQAAAIIHTIIQLCKNLNLEVVAEGVETHEELKFLLDHRCDVVQGHYFSPALNAEDLAQYVRQQSWVTLLADPVATATPSR